MKILIIHNTNFKNMRFESSIDHNCHDVYYVGEKKFLDEIPEEISCNKIVVKCLGDLMRIPEVVFSGCDSFDRVIARHEDTIQSAASIREKFGIPGQLPDIAKNFRSKIEMKNTLRNAGFRVPRFVSGLDFDTVSWSGRTIVKPIDGTASVGVLEFENVSSAVAHIRHLDRDKLDTVEIEEYIDGEIWHVDGYLFDGQPIVVLSSVYLGTPLEYSRGSPVGSVQWPDKEIENWAVECVSALGGDSLTFHLELIMTPDGPVFLEVAARVGGGYIVEAFEKRTGANLHFIDVNSVILGRVDSNHIQQEPDSPVWGFFLFPGHQLEGKLSKVSVPEYILSDPRLVRFEINNDKSLSSDVTYRSQNLPFSGLARGDSPEELQSFIQMVLNEAKIDKGAVLDN